MFGEEALGMGVAMQDAVFAALLVVQHELNSDRGTARPLRIGRIAAIAAHIAGIGRQARVEGGRGTRRGFEQVGRSHSEAFMVGSSMSRTPSPTRLIASTVVESIRPGASRM